MASRSDTKTSRCTHPSLQPAGIGAGAASISLPVLAEHNPKGQIRKSRNAKKRAIVLGTVQGLIIVHIVLWLLSRKYGWWGGQTITPVEPSESMDFVKYGVVNAGLIFFAMALLSTLILGRWFCGWGCHVVLLQDLCGWMMKKCGVRPKPFRSRVLIYVPLLLAVYMFIMPAVHRWGLVPLDARMTESLGPEHWLVQTMQVSFSVIGFPLPYTDMPAWKVSTHLTTTDFWKTFAGVGVAIPFLFICGFAVVYFLGSKGFCTYGCPYGGFFAPLDKLAPGRIVVNDNCEHCGHCTAVCTSNVRVHEEVREYGMVVDPGCMKCLDCVSVCPNEALSFQFTRPAILKGEAKNQRPKKVYDLTRWEEISCALIFLVAFLAFRGVYGLIPMLMAVGIAGIVTFLAWKLWRLVRDPNVSLYRYQLKLKGAMRGSGWLFAGTVTVILLITLNVGVVNGAMTLAQWHDAKVPVRPHLTFSDRPQPLGEAQAAHAAKAIRMYGFASYIGAGGVGPLAIGQMQTDLRIAKLHTERLEFEAAELRLRQSIRRHGEDDLLCSSLMWVLEAQNRRAEALDLGERILAERSGYVETIDTFQQLGLRAREPGRIERILRGVVERDGYTDYTARALMLVSYLQDRVAEALSLGETVLLAERDFTHTLDLYARICDDLDQRGRVIALCRQRLERFPNHLHTMRVLSLELYETGQVAEGVHITKQTIAIDPHNASAYYFLALGLHELDRGDEAIAAMREAARLGPRSVPIHAMMAELLNAAGRHEEAETYRQRAQQLHEEQVRRAQQQ